jgi:hypothetical protein
MGILARNVHEVPQLCAFPISCRQAQLFQRAPPSKHPNVYLIAKCVPIEPGRVPCSSWRPAISPHGRSPPGRWPADRFSCDHLRRMQCLPHRVVSVVSPQLCKCAGLCNGAMGIITQREGNCPLHSHRWHVGHPSEHIQRSSRVAPAPSTNPRGWPVCQRRTHCHPPLTVRIKLPHQLQNWVQHPLVGRQVWI